DGEIVFVSGGTGGFLELPRGTPSRDLLEMVPRDLRVELRATLRRAVESRRAITRRDVSLTKSTGEIQQLNLKVEPLRGTSGGEPLFIVFFQHTEAASPA